MSLIPLAVLVVGGGAFVAYILRAIAGLRNDSSLDAPPAEPPEPRTDSTH